jgi:hypothetical protein
MLDRPSSRKVSAIPNQIEMYYVSQLYKSNCLVSLIMVTTSESVIQRAPPGPSMSTEKRVIDFIISSGRI